MKTIILVTSLLLLCIGVKSVSQQKSQDKELKKQIAAGKKIFAMYCVSCHGTSAQYEGDLKTSYTRLGEAALKKYILNAPAHGNKRMPVFENVLKEHEVNSLVMYLKFLPAK